MLKFLCHFCTNIQDACRRSGFRSRDIIFTKTHNPLAVAVQVGDRVYTSRSLTGSYATAGIFAESAVQPLPAAFSFKEVRSAVLYGHVGFRGVANTGIKAKAGTKGLVKPHSWRITKLNHCACGKLGHFTHACIRKCFCEQIIPNFPTCSLDQQSPSVRVFVPGSSHRHRLCDCIPRTVSERSSRTWPMGAYPRCLWWCRPCCC